MPLVSSQDPGNRNGKVHSHRFPAANMAVAYVNKDHEQMKITEGFLKSGFISVDIFAASPVEETPGHPEMIRRAGSEGPQLMSTFAVGEESEQSGGQVLLREVGRMTAPIDRAGAVFRPGSNVRIDVVVRTRKIGHFFPAGTVDSFDVWLELQGKDASGRIVYWSGMTEDGGKGPVEKGAHFYRSFLLDGEGNPINKRNAWQARSVMYVRLIPPGAADVGHFRIRIPEDAKGPITLTAKLNYRKFSHYYNQYVFAGKPKEGQDASLAGVSHDSREYTFEKANIPANVSGKIKGMIPDLPIITMASATAQLNIGDKATETVWEPKVRKEDRERWNDWGIGLLLQGDLKGAEYAFKKVTEAEPEYADGWLNVARALIQEGETEAAKPYIEKALSINDKLGRIHFFKAMIEKADGDYDKALASLKTVESIYPRDRVVLNQIGRLLFLKRDYAGAVAALERVLQVDPEDVQAHYTLMLAHRGLGNSEAAQRAEKLFRRFKADEASQTITAKPRMLSPEDNNERQMIHDHENALPPARGKAGLPSE
jgi:tetratricopeptide (TPR) repeat protein